MSETSMEDFLGGLSSNTRQFIAFWIEPFDFVVSEAQRRKDVERRFLESHVEETVDFGEPIGRRTYFVPKGNIREAVAKLVGRKDEIVGLEADHYVDELERTNAQCSLPDLKVIEDLHSQHPVFGLLLAVHDSTCQACHRFGEDGYEERTAEAERVVAGLSPDEQQIFCEWAQRLLHARLKPRYGRGDVEEEPIGSFIEAIHQTVHSGNVCFMAEAITDENMVWTASHPYFLREVLLTHTALCPRFKERWRVFEETRVTTLPTTAQQVYRASAALLTAGASHIF